MIYHLCCTAVDGTKYYHLKTRVKLYCSFTAIVVQWQHEEIT